MPRDGTEEGTPPGAPGLSALLAVTPMSATSQLLELATCALSHSFKAPEPATKSPKTEDSVVADPVLRSPTSPLGRPANTGSLLSTAFVQQMVEQSVADHFQKTFGVEVVQGATEANRIGSPLPLATRISARAVAMGFSRSVAEWVSS